jgi:hypothetical protein
MPPWGRPPGARLGRQSNGGWDRQSWEQYNERFEELDTDYENYPGVHLDNRGYATKRFASDELRFTGIDLTPADSRARRRRTNYDYDEVTDPEYDGPDDEPGPSFVPPGMQLILRTKEEELVERALDRIARARALGKTNVKLSQAEIDALERAERENKRSAPPTLPKPVPKNKKAAQTRPKAQGRKKSKGEKSASNSPKVKAIEAARNGTSRGRSSTGSREGALVPYPILTDEPEDYSPPGRYDSDGYFMPASVRPPPSSGPASRTASSHSLRQQQSYTPPVPPALQQYYVGRYSSNPDASYAARPGSNSSRASRPDPSDLDWEPRARSTSNLVSYPVDQLPYQTQTRRAPRFDPADPRFASPAARRVASGPAAVQTSPLGHRRSSDDTQEGMTSDDEDNGVQVDLEESEDGEYRIQTRNLAITDGVRRRGGQNRRGRSGRGR